MPLFGIATTPPVQERLAAGAPVVPIDDLPARAGLEPGRPVRLLDRRGEAQACGVADPENGVIRIWGDGELSAFDGFFFRARLEEAFRQRDVLGLLKEEGAFRLINGEGDGLSGLTLDVYGPYGVICALSRGLSPMARALAESALRVSADLAGGRALRGVVVKLRAKGTAGGKASAQRPKDEIVGEPPPEKLIVEELGIPYELHLTGGLNVGLFTDMREHRRGLARFVRGRRVLNTFAYTGALSVAAARAGAAEVTSVDLAGGVLSWAQQNFRLSGLDPTDRRFRFEVGDVMKFLAKAAAGGRSYDVIILDPPTVSGAGPSLWAQKKDYPDLIAAAAALLPSSGEGGHLWVSSNTHAGRSVLRHIGDGLKKVGRRGAVLELGGLPPDYPTLAAWPEGRYLEVCQLKILGR